MNAAPSLVRSELKVGQVFRLKPDAKRLYVNDNYQYGVWIQEHFNPNTICDGEVASGQLDPTQTIDIRNLCLEEPIRRNEFIIVNAWQIGGKFAGYRDGVGITMDLLNECFEAS